ncbi:MAG TPA: glycosyltransferase family 39 protein [Candidatus Saccharimonadales bacterium]|nr:glycosyltransferase family 39 protein [Candidatus Saccharimonadales bacterium]
MKKFQLLLFIAIVILALFFRFYQLSSVPPSPSLDEATIGWNAYSLLLTGHDEYGYHLPILLRAYDDYRPALYVYLVIPFIKLLGLQVLAVRLPAAILSIATVIATYFFTTVVFKENKNKYWIGILAMFLLSISPFHVYISRLGHEVNPGLTFAFLGALFFLLGVYSKKSWIFFLMGIFWAAAFYTYQSEKIFIPFLFIVLVSLFWKQLWEKKKIFILSVILMTILSLPIVVTSFSPQSLIRLKGTSVFTDNPLYTQTAKQLLLDKQNHNYVAEIIHNRRITTVEIFLTNYFSHYNPIWWTTNGGDEQFKIPGLGLSYWWELPLFILGIFFLLKSRLPISLKILPLAWIGISFIAPGITTQAPHAMRSYNILPIPQLLEALGIVEIFSLLVKFKNRYALVGYVFLILLIFIISVSQLFYDYFTIFPIEEGYQFQYTLGKSIAYIDSQEKNYRKVVISNRNNAYQSYMFYLFYTKYSPVLYWQEGGTASGGYAEMHQINNVLFMPVHNIKLENNVLYIGNYGLTPNNIQIKKIFYGLAGKPKLVAFIKK